MCTAISITAGDNYFGRNLDYECSFGEKVTVTPRNYKFTFTNGSKTEKHYAIIGMALTKNEYPLYFDAMNEKGLSMAGLRFADNAAYNKEFEGKDNIASFEFISYILAKCKNVNEAERVIENINITDRSFDVELKPSPLHWLIADKEKAITVEQTERGIRIFDNPFGVLTNNPPFDMQLHNIRNYLMLSSEEPKNSFAEKVDLTPYSRGMGAIGLPGDLSSMSRFVKTCFLCANSVFGESEQEKVSHFLHILYSVYQLRGVVKVGKDYEITHYTSCCNSDKGIYYYTTYGNSEIKSVKLYDNNLNESRLIIFD